MFPVPADVWEEIASRQSGRVPDIARKPLVEGRQLLGVAGSLLILGGLALPGYSRWGSGPHCLLDVGSQKEVPLAALILLVLALLTMGLSIRRCYVFCWVGAFVGYLLLHLALVEGVEITQSISANVPPPSQLFCGFSRDAVTLGPGCYVPTVGLLLLLAAGLADVWIECGNRAAAHPGDRPADMASTRGRVQPGRSPSSRTRHRQPFLDAPP